MSTLITTQTLTATSGVRNSGGIVNIAGPIVVTDIQVVPASGQSVASSLSGVVLAINHATSGMFAQLSGEELFRFDGAAHSGLGAGNVTASLPAFQQLQVGKFCPSGVVTLNSGTHAFDIIVNFRV